MLNLFLTFQEFNHEMVLDFIKTFSHIFSNIFVISVLDFMYVIDVLELLYIYYIILTSLTGLVMFLN